MIALFQQHFVKTGVFPIALARTLPQVFESRQTSDYADVAAPDEEQIRIVRSDVASFVHECKRLVEAVVSDGEP